LFKQTFLDTLVQNVDYNYYSGAEIVVVGKLNEKYGEHGAYENDESHLAGHIQASTGGGEKRYRVEPFFKFF
jgi:hypothetical protein